jgi:hypothetical protein
MRKLNRFFSLLMFASSLLWSLPGLTFAQGQCLPGPTITETIEEDFCWIECELPNPCDCEFPVLITYPGPEEAVIAPGESLMIRVCGGAPPFTWSVTGDNGWTLDHDDTDTSYNILRLSYGPDCATHGATGTVTVTDFCGAQDSLQVRNNQASWNEIGRGSGTELRCYNCGDMQSFNEVIATDGEYLRWKAMQWRYKTSPGCQSPCAYGGGWQWTTEGWRPPPCGGALDCAGQLGSCSGNECGTGPYTGAKMLGWVYYEGWQCE